MIETLKRAKISFMALLIAAGISLCIAPSAFAATEDGDSGAESVTVTTEEANTSRSESGPAALSETTYTLIESEGTWTSEVLSITDVDGNMALASGQDGFALATVHGTSLSAVAAGESFVVTYSGSEQLSGTIELVFTVDGEGGEAYEGYLTFSISASEEETDSSNENSAETEEPDDGTTPDSDDSAASENASPSESDGSSDDSPSEGSGESSSSDVSESKDEDGSGSSSNSSSAEDGPGSSSDDASSSSGSGGSTSVSGGRRSGSNDDDFASSAGSSSHSSDSGSTGSHSRSHGSGSSDHAHGSSGGHGHTGSHAKDDSSSEGAESSSSRSGHGKSSSGSTKDGDTAESDEHSGKSVHRSSESGTQEYDATTDAESREQSDDSPDATPLSAVSTLVASLGAAGALALKRF